MAMPSYPPPDQPSLTDQVLELASTMAKSVGCGVGDVLRRTKSRNWMLGRLRRLLEGRDDEEIREAIAALSKQHRPTIGAEETTVELRSRRPTKGLEPSGWPCWAVRGEALGELVVYPMGADELIRRSTVRLRWPRNLTIQSLAAAEDAGETWFDGTVWNRTKERILVANQKTKIVRLTRHLPVELKGEDRADIISRLNAVDDERRALEAELEEQKRSLTAKLRERAAARERLVESLKTGRETQLVTCEERHDYGTRSVTVVRKDTGEAVESREMTADELQLAMPGTSPS